MSATPSVHPCSPPMTREEAVSCVAAINSGFDDLYKNLLALRDLKGWEALGYESWNACVEGEFAFSRRRANQLLQHAQVQQNVGTMVPISERAARPLVGLEPDKQREAFAEAVKTSDGKPTVTHTERAVTKVTGRPQPTRVVRDADAQETPDYDGEDSAPVPATPTISGIPTFSQEEKDSEQLGRMKKIWRKTELARFWNAYAPENKRALLAWIEKGA